MPGRTACGNWMHYNHLDGGNDLDGAYVIGYRITDDDGTDQWTTRFNRFKAKDGAAFAGGAAAINGSMLALLGALGVKPADAVFVPALGSGETQAAATGQIPTLARQAPNPPGPQFRLGRRANQ